MRRTILLALVLLIPDQSTVAQVETRKERLKPSSDVLQVSVIPEKAKYRSGDSVALRVIIENLRFDGIYVSSSLGFGHFGSFTLHVLDHTGKEIQPVGGIHSSTMVQPPDAIGFVRLEYKHFLGASFVSPLNLLNMHRPGRYRLYVEYQSTIGESDASVRPFWGRERGSLKSNVVSIEVRR